MFTTALFDYDGTLANTDAVHHACWNQCLVRYGLSIDEAFYSKVCSGALSFDIARAIIEHFALSDILADGLAKQKDQAYQVWIHSERIALMKGVPELLDYLMTQGFKLGIVTGAPYSAIEKTLHDHALAHFFTCFVSREDVSHGKPDPQGYLLALECLNAQNVQAVSFEETRSGVLAAKRAGMLAFAIPNAYTKHHDFKEANAKFNDLIEAQAALKLILEG